MRIEAEQFCNKLVEIIGENKVTKQQGIYHTPVFVDRPGRAH